MRNICVFDHSAHERIWGGGGGGAIGMEQEGWSAHGYQKIVDGSEVELTISV